ncbi:receptor-transporting protein 4 [Marmota flaviventris]|uniref:receptor-transporting protein 4 n=1 Tax=Marmota flaviventris TaxID=93162 RepID=UPI003A8C3604
MLGRRRMYLDVSTWEQKLQELIQQEKPWAKWTLKLDENIQPGGMARGWRQYMQRAFGRFCCSSCHRSWASAQVKILCHMSTQHRIYNGQVLLRIFAQRCQKCSWSQFENPEFSSDSTMRILNNLAQCILHSYYGHNFRKMPVAPVVGLNGPHDRSNCEACTLGICVRGSQVPIKKPTESPPSGPNPRVLIFYGNEIPGDPPLEFTSDDIIRIFCFALFFIVWIVICAKQNKSNW